MKVGLRRFAILRFLVFAIVLSIVVTLVLMPFMSILAYNLGNSFTEEQIKGSALIGVFCIFLLSLLFTIIDYLWSYFTVDRPVGRIRNCLDEYMKGNFDARLPKRESFAMGGGFGPIYDSINKLGKELGGVETLRTDFISNVSHEIKTPLSVIQNYGMLLSAPDLDDGSRVEYAKMITESSRRLASLVSNILRLNKLENQQIFPNATQFNLSESVCSVLLQFEDIWTRKSIELNVDIEEDVRLVGDEDLLGLVWSNLFSNAFKFTPEGGRVDVSLKREGNVVRLCVEDSGCGIDPSLIPHIWDKFYQCDTSHSGEGNGLGLALVKRVVDISGGQVSCTSEIGKGSMFSVVFEAMQ